MPSDDGPPANHPGTITPGQLSTAYSRRRQPRSGSWSWGRTSPTSISWRESPCTRTAHNDGITPDVGFVHHLRSHVLHLRFGDVQGPELAAWPGLRSGCRLPAVL